MVREWDLASNDIKAVLSNKTIKLLVTCRSHIFLSRHFQIIKLLSDSKYDLNSTTNSLKYNEKELIAKAYLNDVEIEQISEHIMLYDFFPMLCQIYRANKTVDIKTFFSFPVQVIQDELTLVELTRMMNAVDRTTYAVLVLFVIYNNDLQEELLSRNSDIKSILDGIVDVCELQFNLSKQIIKSHLDNLEGSYIKKTGNAYHVLSDKIFDIVVAFYGNHMFDYILEMAHSEIIRDRYLFSSLEDDVECVIKVQLDKEQPYFDRVISDIRNGFLCNVFNNRQLLYTAYRQKFVQYLESQTDISKLLEMSSQSELSPLLTIADQGYHDIGETLINFKLDVDVRDKNGRTPLFLSSRKGYKEMTLLLLKNNCNPNLCTNDRLSPLYAATSQGHIEVVKILLQHGSVPDLCDKRGRSPLLLAASNGSTKIVEALLECSSNPNLSDQEGTTPLLIATHWGNTDTVKLLLEKKCCPNLCKEGVSPPLNVAVANGQIEIVKLLLKHKCDPNSLDKQDLPTLYVAARKSFIEILDILLQNLDVNDKTRVESLLTSITRSEEHVLKLLLEHKCIPSIQEKLPILGCALSYSASHCT
ncbi:ANK [Mytilus coruscus]|uniref:ANK n=1 Tax=Mytilus coruscus TaxID=42192 RepID=A0A6J8E927_MYTCO|nr:ANK [Mytilus coruscus]